MCPCSSRSCRQRSAQSVTARCSSTAERWRHSTNRSNRRRNNWRRSEGQQATRVPHGVTLFNGVWSLHRSVLVALQKPTCEVFKNVFISFKAGYSFITSLKPSVHRAVQFVTATFVSMSNQKDNVPSCSVESLIGHKMNLFIVSYWQLKWCFLNEVNIDLQQRSERAHNFH